MVKKTPPNEFMPDPIRKTCKIAGCKNEHYSRGWCQKHYRRAQRNGHPLHGAKGKVYS